MEAINTRWEAVRRRAGLASSGDTLRKLLSEAEVELSRPSPPPARLTQLERELRTRRPDLDALDDSELATTYEKVLQKLSVSTASYCFPYAGVTMQTAQTLTLCVHYKTDNVEPKMS